MARPLIKAERRLGLRQTQHDISVKRAKDGGKSYTRPGSMNPHKTFPTGRKKVKKR